MILIGAAVILAGALRSPRYSRERKRARALEAVASSVPRPGRRATGGRPHLLAGMAAVARVELAADEDRGGAQPRRRLRRRRRDHREPAPAGPARQPRGARRGPRRPRSAGRAADVRQAAAAAALGVPIVSGGTVVGAVTATVAEATARSARGTSLASTALAAEAGRQLGPRAAWRCARDAG